MLKLERSAGALWRSTLFFSFLARRIVYRYIILAICLVHSAAAADAQLVLQQPVVGVTGVQTVVSVPDGGSALLGRIDRAKDSRASYGFTPFGSSLGREVSRSGMDVSVTIHDFEAMDEWLLAQPRKQDYQFRQQTAATAWEQLGGATSRAQASVPAMEDSTIKIPVKPRGSADVASLAHQTPADRLLSLGDSALARSDRVGALRYYQSARRLGSTVAAQRIQLLLAD